ncbi:hypothetical protein U5903_07970 [Cereibacter johrii]|uniref:hypothetical protein n=1 Tax=Cereibacter johrii TaxID=445629 RepID=UPI002B25E30C|nr:hypothetical protein [Cereibacter johrii]MEA5160708.1 hypothetical protein [Cereibacter johrii]
MDDWAKLLTAVAAVLSAVAWPLALFLTAFLFRDVLRSAINRIPSILDRVKTASIAGVRVELERVADAEKEDEAGKVTPNQKEVAARIAVEKSDLGSQPLLKELDRLCLEFDALRRNLPSGDIRTRAMTRVMVQMRSLSPSLIEFIDAYKGSGSAGSRLAAIAMMQMVPTSADVGWLEGRFKSDPPFIFYHAALALQNALDSPDTSERRLQEIREAARRALERVRSFSGTPDHSTVEVLKTMIAGTS